MKTSVPQHPEFVVTLGKFRANCYLDGDTLRDITDQSVKAWRKDGKWNKPVKRIPLKRASDLVVPCRHLALRLEQSDASLNTPQPVTNLDPTKLQVHDELVDLGGEG